MKLMAQYLYIYISRCIGGISHKTNFNISIMDRETYLHGLKNHFDALSPENCLRFVFLTHNNGTSSILITSMSIFGEFGRYTLHTIGIFVVCLFDDELKKCRYQRYLHIIVGI